MRVNELRLTLAMACAFVGCILSVSSTGIEHVVNRVVLGLRKVRAISLPASVVGAKPRTY
jgi:hypothetical protein